MKKIMFTILTLVLFVTSVSAVTMKDEEIDPYTIVIGTHLFTLDSNEETGYTGLITTKFAMLGATSLADGNVEDMKIYYKWKDRDWTDFITYEVLDAPEEFEITHINGTCIDPSCDGTTYDVKFIRSEYNEEKIVKVPFSTKVSKNNAPTINERIGYKFSFWSLKDAEGEYNFDAPITEDIELEANWRQINYKITYHSNFGTDKTNEITCTYDRNNLGTGCKLENYNVVLGTYSNVGHEPTGWSTNPTGPIVDDIEKVLKTGEEIDLYEIWDTTTYSFKYGDNTIICNYDEYCSLSDLEYETPNGYVFSNWRTAEDKAFIPTLIRRYTIDNKTIEVEPEFEPIDYNIRYDFNGGEYTDGNPIIINVEDTGKELSVAPTRVGYTFDKWVLVGEEENLTATLTGNILKLKEDKPGDVKLKALWKSNKLTIKFEDEDNNKYVDTDGNEIENIICDYEDLATCVITAVAKNTTDNTTKFGGWTYDGLVYEINTVIDNPKLFRNSNNEIKVQPKWVNKDQYKIHYNLEGSTFDATPVTSYIEEIDEVDLPTPNKTGYTFIGWKTEESEEVFEDNTIENPAGNYELYPVWRPNVYIIEYYNDDDTLIGREYREYNETFNLGEDYNDELEDRNHIGWGIYKDVYFYDRQVEIRNVGTEEGEVVKLYAIFQKDYKVSYNLDGGELPTSELPKSHIDLSGIIPTREGYDFVEWQANGSKVTGPLEINQNTSITAIWSPKELTITFVSDNPGTMTTHYNQTIIDMGIIEDELRNSSWILDDEEIEDIVEYLKTTPLTRDITIYQVHKIDVIEDGETTTYKVKHGDKFTESLDTTKHWLVDDSEEDLEDFLVNTEIEKNYTIERLYEVKFIYEDTTEESYYVKYGEKVDPTELSDEVKATYWTINGLKMSAHNIVVTTEITEDIELNENTDESEPPVTPAG